MIHTVPVNDLFDHITDGECWCSPLALDDQTVHNSADGREHYEPDHDWSACSHCLAELI